MYVCACINIFCFIIYSNWKGLWDAKWFSFHHTCWTCKGSSNKTVSSPSDPSKFVGIYKRLTNGEKCMKHLSREYSILTLLFINLQKMHFSFFFPWKHPPKCETNWQCVFSLVIIVSDKIYFCKPKFLPFIAPLMTIIALTLGLSL